MNILVYPTWNIFPDNVIPSIAWPKIIYILQYNFIALHILNVFCLRYITQWTCQQRNRLPFHC